MAQSESANGFTPKQALVPSPELYEELIGDCMESVAKATLAHLPPIADGAVIHDNGCGTGAATAAIMATLTSTTQVSIKGTDINENTIQQYRKNAADKSWPAEGQPMDSSALLFPDNTFTHSIGNSFIFVLPDDGVNAMKETYRTLKPGGVAAVNCWASLPNLDPLQAAAQATRPESAPLPRHGLDKWYEPAYLQGVMEKAGFEKVTMVKADVYATVSEITRYAALLWSFNGGSAASPWLTTDEENWDKAVEVVKRG